MAISKDKKIEFDIFAVGNALVDHEYYVNDDFIESMQLTKGTMTLVEKDQFTAIRNQLEAYFPNKVSSMGGSAANTAYLCQQLGLQCYFSGLIGEDSLGRYYKQAMDVIGLNNNLLYDPHPGSTGQCLIMITPDAERTMCTYLGISSALSQPNINFDQLQSAKLLYVEGYLAAMPKAHHAIHLLIKKAKYLNIPIAVSLSDPKIVSDCLTALYSWLDLGVDLLFCNEREALIFTQTDELERASSLLQNYSKIYAITLGGKGSFLYDGLNHHFIPPVSVDVKDTLGAGDAFAASFLFALNKGMKKLNCANFANYVSAQMVAQKGARFSYEKTLALKKYFEKLFLQETSNGQ